MLVLDVLYAVERTFPYWWRVCEEIAILVSRLGDQAKNNNERERCFLNGSINTLRGGGVVAFPFLGCRCLAFPVRWAPSTNRIIIHLSGGAGKKTSTCRVINHKKGALFFQAYSTQYSTVEVYRIVSFRIERYSVLCTCVLYTVQCTIACPFSFFFHPIGSCGPRRIRFSKLPFTVASNHCSEAKDKKALGVVIRT
jgi:hypothetical protein